MTDADSRTDAILGRLHDLKKIFREVKISKKPREIQNSPLRKVSRVFCHKTIGPIGFHDNVVIIQQKLRFPKKIFLFQIDFKVI